jgi:hypothetical protein
MPASRRDWTKPETSRRKIMSDFGNVAVKLRHLGDAEAKFFCTAPIDRLDRVVEEVARQGWYANGQDQAGLDQLSTRFVYDDTSQPYFEIVLDWEEV